MRAVEITFRAAHEPHANAAALRADDLFGTRAVRFAQSFYDEGRIIACYRQPLVARRQDDFFAVERTQKGVDKPRRTLFARRFGELHRAVGDVIDGIVQKYDVIECDFENDPHARFGIFRRERLDTKTQVSVVFEHAVNGFHRTRTRNLVAFGFRKRDFEMRALGIDLAQNAVGVIKWAFQSIAPFVLFCR